MPMHNAEIAGIFNRLADLLEIEEANPFRVRAYRSAAQTVSTLPRSAADMLDEGEDLSELPNIGKDLAGKIQEIVEIEDSKQVPLDRFLHALGVRHVGRQMAQQFGTLDAIRTVKLSRLEEIPDVGPETARADHEFFEEPANCRVLDRLIGGKSS